MLTLFIISILLTFLYILLLIYFSLHWNRIPTIEQTSKPISLNATILIAARNEEDHITACVESCLKQQNPYGAFEVIVVDDQSNDDTHDLLKEIKDPRFSLMRLGVYKKTTIKGSKKKAIAYGVNHAKGDIILTTDADCIVPEKWLAGMLSYFSDPNVHLVCGPVRISSPNNFLDYLQALDFTANGFINAAGLHSGSHDLCNGANMAYRTKSFLENKVYDDNYEIASGDDVFLLQQFRKNMPQSIRFAKNPELIVETHALKSLSAFLFQRLRWAGKLSHIQNARLKMISAFVWLQRAMLPITLILLAVQASFFLFEILAGALLLQWMANYFLQVKANRFYDTKSWKKWFIPVEIAHAFYYLALGILSFLPMERNWKGRKA